MGIRKTRGQCFLMMFSQKSFSFYNRCYFETLYACKLFEIDTNENFLSILPAEKSSINSFLVIFQTENFDADLTL